MQIPYALGYLYAPANAEYTGLLINLEDYSYHAIMLQGYNGAWTYHIQATTEPHHAAFLYGFYLFLGQLARTLGLSIVAMWHTSRIIVSLVLCLVTFGFIGILLDDARERWTAYLLAIFGSGLDWALFPWERFDAASSIPIDFRMPEAHIFFSAMTFPHVALGIALVLASFWLWRKYLGSKNWNDVAALAAAILLICIIYPFFVLLLSGVLGTDWVLASYRSRKILWRQGLALGAAFAPSFPLNLYYVFVLQTNSVFRVWNEQAATLSPNPLHYLLAYGVLIALALLLLHGQERHKFMILWVWIAVVALLLYAPLGAQRRFVQGVQVPLAILASAGLYRVLFPRLEKANWFQRLVSRPNYSRVGLERFAVVLLLLALSTANLVVLLKLSDLTAIEQPAAFFVPRAEVAAIDWLGANTRRDDPILAAYWTSGYIPARSGNVVFAGQRYETNRFDEKRLLVEKFFDVSTDDAFRRNMLTQYRIAYLFWGGQERALGDFDPAWSDYLEQVYDKSGVQIYRFRMGMN